MPNSVIGKYDPCFSPRAIELLSKEAAKNFTIGTTSYATGFFKEFSDRFGDTISLNYQLLSVAINSSFLDLESSIDLHEMKGGPSPSKKGAAVACWLNRLKPIQIHVVNLDERVWYINSHFALLVSLLIKFQDEDRHGIISEVVNENSKINNLIYALMWRNPSYRELTTVFEFI